MCVLHVSFGSKVKPRTFGCVAMGSAVLFILRSSLLVFSVGAGVIRVQVVLSGFSVILLCFVQAKLFVCMVVSFFCCTRDCICRCDGDVCIVHDLNRCPGWW